MGRRGRRHKQLLYDLKEETGYGKLKEEKRKYEMELYEEEAMDLS